MEEYIGLDVSMKETAMSIHREGERIWRGKCASDPNIVAGLVRKRAPAAKRVVFETGPLSVWFYHALRAKGLPAICIDARHAKAALDKLPCPSVHPDRSRSRPVALTASPPALVAVAEQAGVAARPARPLHVHAAGRARLHRSALVRADVGLFPASPPPLA